MTSDILGLLLATAFIAGCVAHHALREHAKALTPSLVIVANCLHQFVFLVAMAETPRTKKSNAEAQFVTPKLRCFDRNLNLGAA